MDPFQRLGVSRTATQDEIKDAYRKLAKKHHPDLNPGNKSAEQAFKEISQAYELIGSAEARAKFERGEAEAAEFARARAHASRGAGPFYHQTQEGGAGGRYSFQFGGGSGGPGTFDEDDLFSQIFRQARGQASRARSREPGPIPGQDEIYRLDIDLADTVRDGTREIQLPSGKKLSVRIPAGVTTGTQLRFQGQGQPGYGGGPPGDVYVELHVRPSEKFRPEGRNVVMELPIQLEDAVLGGQVATPTLDGTVQLRIPPGMNTDKKLRIAGKGLYDRASRTRGDQIVVLKIVLPEVLDSRIVDAIRAARGERAA